MIQYQKIETKEDYLRWQMHYKFRDKLIREGVEKMFKAMESSAENKQVTNQNK